MKIIITKSQLHRVKKKLAIAKIAKSLSGNLKFTGNDYFVSKANNILPKVLKGNKDKVKNGIQILLANTKHINDQYMKLYYSRELSKLLKLLGDL